jgi:hypothetical protein
MKHNKKLPEYEGKSVGYGLEICMGEGIAKELYIVKED